MTTNAHSTEEARNFHTLARRYCMEESTRWKEIYSKQAYRPMFGDYSDEAYDTFPRYNALDAILEGVETIEPDPLENRSAMQSRLIEAASTESLMTKGPNNAIAQKAMDEERRKFVEYIKGVDDDELIYVEPLFYRRRFTEEELAARTSVLKDRWKTDLGYWYPLVEKPEGLQVESFHTTIFENEFGYERLYESLARHGVLRVFEIGEGGSGGYEVDISGSSATYPTMGFGELWWTDKDASFVIYASHESSITFGGWILDDVKAAWPTWERRTYTGWDQA